MANELIVTFTHTNYCLHSAGTEKFAREYSELLQGEGYTNLAFFAIEPRLGNTPKYTGVILDDFFMGRRCLFKINLRYRCYNHDIGGIAGKRIRGI